MFILVDHGFSLCNSYLSDDRDDEDDDDDDDDDDVDQNCSKFNGNNLSPATTVTYYDESNKIIYRAQFTLPLIDTEFNFTAFNTVRGGLNLVGVLTLATVTFGKGWSLVIELTSKADRLIGWTK